MKLSADARFAIDVRNNPDEARRWRRLLGDLTWKLLLDNRQTKDGVVYVDGTVVTKALIHYSVQNGTISSAKFGVISVVSACLQASVPGISRVICASVEPGPGLGTTSCGHGFFGDDWMGYVFCAMNMFALANAAGAFVGFMLTTVASMRRDVLVNKRIGKLLAFNVPQSFGRQNLKRRGKFPIIDVQDPRELYGWLLCHMVFKEFGSTRRKQTEICVTLGGLSTVILLAWFTVLFVQNFSNASVLRSDMLVHIALFEMAFYAVFAYLCIASGSASNQYGEMHILQLIQHKLKNHDDDVGFLAASSSKRRANNASSSGSGSTPNAGKKNVSQVPQSLAVRRALEASSGGSGGAKNAASILPTIADDYGSFIEETFKKADNKSKESSINTSTSVGATSSADDVEIDLDDDGVELREDSDDDDDAVSFDEDMQPDFMEGRSEMSSMMSEVRLSEMGDGSVAETRRHTERLLSAGIQSMEQSNLVEPYSFLGSRASLGGGSSFASVFASGLFFMIQSIFL